MRYLLTLFLCAAAFGADDGERSRHTAGLVGRWIVPGYQTGNGAVPTSTLDVSGRGFFGATVASPAYGGSRPSLALNGSSQYVAISVDKVVGKVHGSAGVTQSAWVLWRGPTAASQQVITFFIIGDDNVTGFRMDIMGTTGYFRVGGRSTYADSFQSASTATYFTSNSWRHVCGTLDFAKNKAAVFVNGVLVTSANVTFGSTTYVTSVPTVRSHCLGGDEVNAYKFNGSIADVRIYNRALTAAEVAALYKEGLR